MLKRTWLLFALPSIFTAVFALSSQLARSEEARSANQITVDNFTFMPQTITVPPNSTVTWVNKDDIPHVIASTDGTFKSKALDTDAQYSYTFTKSGTYKYYCSIHPKMTGTVVVQ